ncbi:hypothetical protein [Actinoplanes subtropicus]|uniref:hypothetical protein n=1 Tax=Actinoplanes subtropicus TaxID=543632 RepID=UPI0012F796BC|nr:hypothetical protein [Actinoplanes subtropicus]
MTVTEPRLDGQREMVDVERRAMRKIRRAFLPIIAMCLFMLYVDRLNISVAALPMDKQLGVSLTTYGLIAGAFFWTYARARCPATTSYSVWVCGSGSPGSSSPGAWSPC